MIDEERIEPKTLQQTADELGGTVGTCNGCKAKVVWAWTKNGKAAPYDAGGASHFATCPFAAQFRKPRGSAANV